MRTSPRISRTRCPRPASRARPGPRSADRITRAFPWSACLLLRMASRRPSASPRSRRRWRRRRRGTRPDLSRGSSCSPRRGRSALHLPRSCRRTSPRSRSLWSLWWSAGYTPRTRGRRWSAPSSPRPCGRTPWKAPCRSRALLCHHWQ